MCELGDSLLDCWIREVWAAALIPVEKWSNFAKTCSQPLAAMYSASISALVIWERHEGATLKHDVVI